ncbi:MAG: hypothetical protein RQM92_15070 [Candidatus Syntrophopropionicum ammoniitolerans]
MVGKQIGEAEAEHPLRPLVAQGGGNYGVCFTRVLVITMLGFYPR